MDFSTFFEPFHLNFAAKKATIGHITNFYNIDNPQWESADIIVLGVECDADNFDTVNAIRKHFYDLVLPHEKCHVVDFGNLIPRESKQASLELVGYLLNHWIEAGKIVIILAENREIAYGQALAYRYFGNKELEENSEAEAVYLSSSLDMKAESIHEREITNYRILNTYPPLYQNLSILGVQKYRVTQPEWDLIQNLNFAVLRYGEIYENIHEIEPYLREANAVCLDMSCVRHADSPGSNRPSPGGFSTMEICQIGRYIGSSAHISSFCLTEIQHSQDIHEQSALLSAMVLWYFLEGFYYRKIEIPTFDNKQFRRFEVKMNAGIEQLIFLQSLISKHWWMEVRNENQTRFIPCSEKEYHTALGDEIPDKWWQAYYRLG